MNSVSSSMHNEKQSNQLLFGLFDEEMSGTLSDYLTRIISPGPATMMLRESMRHATRTIIHRHTELTKAVSGTKTLQDIGSY